MHYQILFFSFGNTMNIYIRISNEIVIKPLILLLLISLFGQNLRAMNESFEQYYGLVPNKFNSIGTVSTVECAQGDQTTTTIYYANGMKARTCKTPGVFNHLIKTIKYKDIKKIKIALKQFGFVNRDRKVIQSALMLTEKLLQKSTEPARKQKYKKTILLLKDYLAKIIINRKFAKNIVLAIKQMNSEEVEEFLPRLDIAHPKAAYQFLTKVELAFFCASNNQTLKKPEQFLKIVNLLEEYLSQNQVYSLLKYQDLYQ